MSIKNFSLSHLKAEDLMTSNVFTLNPQNTLREAINLLIQNKVSAAPVMSADHHLLTIVSEWDLMRIAVISGLDGIFHENLKHLTPADKIKTVQRKTPFLDLFKLFLEENHRRIVVVDINNRLQGIIARRDIIRKYLEYENKK